MNAPDRESAHTGSTPGKEKTTRASVATSERTLRQALAALPNVEAPATLLPRVWNSILLEGQIIQPLLFRGQGFASWPWQGRAAFLALSSFLVATFVVMLYQLDAWGQLYVTELSSYGLPFISSCKLLISSIIPFTLQDSVATLWTSPLEGSSPIVLGCGYLVCVGLVTLAIQFRKIVGQPTLLPTSGRQEDLMEASL